MPVRTFLEKLHLRCRKVGMIPAKADPEQQAVYLHPELEPRLAEAQARQRAVFFVAAAYFVLMPFLGFLWSLGRMFIQAPTGRQRFNILGALNAVTHELIPATNDTYITPRVSASCCASWPLSASVCRSRWSWTMPATKNAPWCWQQWPRAKSCCRQRNLQVSLREASFGILSIIRGNTAFPVLPIAHPVNADAHRQGSSAVLG